MEPVHRSARVRSRRYAPRILLLTAALGAGHARAAHAMAAALRNRRGDCVIRTLDFWSLMDEAVAASLQRAYLALVRDRPALYDRIYRLDQRTWRAILNGAPLPDPLLEGLAVLARSARHTLDEYGAGAWHPFDRVMLRAFCGALDGATRLLPGAGSLLRVAIIRSGWTILARRLDAVLRGFRPDAIVATQMNPAALLAHCAQRRRKAIPAVAVVTDFGVHDFWLHHAVDRYCLAHPDVGPRSALRDARATGMPLMPPFEHPLDQASARDRLGLARDANVVLVVGGGLGLGVERLACALLNSTRRIQVLAVSGSNPVAARSLRAHAHERLRAWTWTDDMSLLLRAADVVVGKPGGLTLAEALACGRPLLATDTLRAQEDFNLRFMRRHGVGELVPERGLVAYVEAMFERPEALRALHAHAWALGRRDGAARIAALTLELADAPRGIASAEPR